MEDEDDSVMGIPIWDNPIFDYSKSKDGAGNESDSVESDESKGMVSDSSSDESSDCECYEGPFPLETALRGEKQLIVNEFLWNYTHPPGSGNKVNKEKIIGITSDGESSVHMVAASGVQWIAVHAKKTICIVALWKMDVGSLANTFFSVKPIGDVLTDYMRAVIYKLEDGSLKGIGNMFEKTFGIVSGMHESVDEDYDEESAVKYLKEKSKRHSTFTLKNTIETAIAAFQMLCRKKFKTRDIVVIRLKETDPFAGTMPDDLIKWHLDAINKKLPKKTRKRSMVAAAEAKLPSSPLRKRNNRKLAAGYCEIDEGSDADAR